MNAKKISRLAQRLLAAQLELEPRSKTTIKFECAGHEVCVDWIPERGQWVCVVDRRARESEDIEVPI